MRALAVSLALLLAVALAGVTVRAAPPAQSPVLVTASVDLHQVTVGDRITLTVVIRHAAADIQMDVPKAPAFLGDLEVLEALPPQEFTNPDGSKEVRLTYKVAAFRSGDLSLVPPSIAYVTADGQRGEVVSSAVPIRVESVLPVGQPPADIRDLKPQLAVPGKSVASTRPLLLALVGAAAALALGRLALRWRQRPHPRPQPPPLPPTAYPEDAARAELERIASLDFIARGEYKGFYSGVAACIRRYLTERYGFSAVAMTTSEMEAQMVGRGLDRWQARLVSGLLSECDAVVYARYVPAAARAEGSLDMAYEVVAMAEPERPEALAEGVEQ